jgi:SAM-dependent methyltransferase
MTKIPKRTKKGLEVYLQGCEKSVQEKAKFLPFVKPGKIIELGCGNGVVLDLLSRAFPTSEIEGFEISKEIAKIAKKRKYPNNNVNVFVGDATKKLKKDESCDTVIFCSVLHEIYSYSGLKSLMKALVFAHKMLKKGGRIVIRDGVKPGKEVVYIGFKNRKTKEKFFRFAKDFRPYRIKFRKLKDGKVELSKQDCMEFLTKYFYDINWKVETGEQFGIFTLNEYKNVLKKVGFKIVYSEKYLLPFLKNKYKKDVKIFKKIRNKFVQTSYPDSTMILVGEKV